MNASQPLIVRPPATRPLRERLLTALFTALRAAGGRLQRPPVLPVEPCRIVIVKPCCLGDVLMTTPVIAALRARYPRSAIHYAVGQYAAPAIDGHPGIDRLIDAGPGAAQDWRALLMLWRRMRAGRYDLCVVLERSPRFTILPWLAGIPARAGIDSAGRGFALNVRVPWDESLHEADLYLSVAGALDCPTQGQHLHFAPDEASIRQIDDLWHDHDLREPVIAVAPGGGTNPGMDLPEKRWLPDRFAALADRLHADHGATIVLLGGPADRALCTQVHAAMRAPALDLSGPAPFAERGALLQRCRLYVGNDSGPMHLAVAVGCPVVALFGPTDVGLYGPYHAQARTVRLPLPCSPCFVHGHFPPCPNGHACMEWLPVEQVLQACRELLDAPDTRHKGSDVSDHAGKPQVTPRYAESGTRKRQDDWGKSGRTEAQA
ncbi:MAG TPA: lipopolysaccharide heptosyltransferase II [Chloroflexota bacterium]|nr:lipopolysaccharide heptosyltransferase II [Chloroflexota bacterium]